MRPETISAVGSFTSFASGSGDWVCVDIEACTGCDDAPLRTTVQPRPGDHGAFVFPSFDDAQIITLVVVAMIDSLSSPVVPDDYRAAVETLFQSLRSALDAMKSAPDDLVHEDGTVSVWKHSPVEKSWSGVVCRFTFSVVIDVT